MYWNNLDGKRIGIWGMGREGMAAKAMLEKHCPNAVITEIGEENTEEILKCDILIKSPGISLYRPEIQQAAQHGVIITSGTNLFLANKKRGIPVIAVTGTKGKSTTASLLAHTLEALNKKVILGGNIGKPLVAFTDETADFFVAELSSYQCADLVGRPDIAVLTNLYPEHLQWHGSHGQYYADKMHMIRQAKRCILNGTNPETQRQAAGLDPIWFNRPDGIHISQNTFYDQNQPLFSCDSLHLIGEHNAENACAVLAVVKLLGFDIKRCEAAFADFEPLPHRLQTIGVKDGITYVDDSISTTPETAIAALKALDRGQDITLIAGGMDRGQDYGELVRYIAQKQDRIRLVTLPDTGSRLAAMAQSAGIETSPTSDMPTAVNMAQHLTPAGGLILLSPAAPSYNLYHNFEERGDDFKKWIHFK